LKTLRHVDAQSIYRFKREFRALADIAHPSLIRLGELFCEGEQWFFTMELVHGPDFLAFVRDPGGEDRGDAAWTTTEKVPMRFDAPILDEPIAPTLVRGGACSEPRLRDALAQLVEGLIALHEAGKVHRDLKPSNVLVN